MKFEVECDDIGLWTVRCGDRYQDQLCASEVLYPIALIVIKGLESAGLRTAEQHAAFWESINKPAAADAAKEN